MTRGPRSNRSLLSRNYLGLVLTAEQYSHHGYRVENRVVYNVVPNSEYLKELLWFMMGYQDSILFIVSKRENDLKILIDSGLVLDIRSNESITDHVSFYDYAHSKLSSMKERKRLCDDMRDIFASRQNYRWCGAEYESIFNRKIYSNAREISGKFRPGRHYGLEFIPENIYPELSLYDLSGDIFMNSETFEDLGQKKLSVIFARACITGATIIYVGAAPGAGWHSTLEMFPGVARVVAIDPSPLGIERISERVRYVQKTIETFDDLLEVATHSDQILIWDVRRDMTDESRDESIREDIVRLNAILSDERLYKHFKMIQIKLNNSNLELYALPKGMNITIQPYCLERDTYELRGTYWIESADMPELGRVSAEVILAIRTEQELIRKDVLQNVDVVNSKLIANFLTTRYRICDYMTTDSVFSCEEEIFLYTLNHNSPDIILAKLESLKKRKIRYCGSFFVGKSRGTDPHPFPEGRFMSKGLGTILDSRSFIKAKMTGIYFFISERLNDLFENEMRTSETYLIRSTEFWMLSEDVSSTYDMERMMVAQEAGGVFAKFPGDFSISENLISPSGHAARMIMEVVEGRASLSMLIDKILNSFRRILKSSIAKSAGCGVTLLKSSKFGNVLRNNSLERVSLERSPMKIWHSKVEWICGIRAGLRMAQNVNDFIVGEITSVIGFMDGCILSNSNGMEVTEFQERYYSGVARVDAISRRLRRTSSLLDNMTVEDKSLRYT